SSRAALSREREAASEDEAVVEAARGIGAAPLEPVETLRGSRRASMAHEHEMARAEEERQDRTRIRRFPLGRRLPSATPAVKDPPDVLEKVLGVRRPHAETEPAHHGRRIERVEALEGVVRRELAERAKTHDLDLRRTRRRGAHSHLENAVAGTFSRGAPV